MPLTPLELQGWVDFNVGRTGLQPHRFTTMANSELPDAPGVRAVFYLDRRGRIKLPPNNPYVAVSVVLPSGSRSPGGRTAAWHRLADPLVEEMERLGVANQLYLPPDVDDVRPWIWRNFLVNVRYTYYLDFPWDRSLIGGSAKRDSQLAVKSGMTVERVTDVDPVLECLAAVEERQGFSHHMGRSELQAALSRLGDDAFRMYVCFDRLGRPASTAVMLHSPGTRAVWWIGGTITSSTKNGAATAGVRFAFDDLAAAGATGVDLCGANLASVAAFKSHFGGRLVPNYGVRTYSTRAAARFAVDWRQSRRRAGRSSPSHDPAE